MIYHPKDVFLKFLLVGFGLSPWIYGSVGTADTIHMKDGSSLKGLILEEYKDRLIFSTSDGEKVILQNSIQSFVYDEPASLHIQKAKDSMAEGDWSMAVYYWRKARKINPESATIEKGYRNALGQLAREGQYQRDEEFKRRKKIFELTQNLETQAAEKGASSKVEQLRAQIGILLAEEEGNIIVVSVQPNSPADQAGVRARDLLVSVWDSRVGYRSVEEVAGLMINTASRETQIIIERPIRFVELARSVEGSREGDLGIIWSLEFEGIVAKDVNEGGLGAQAGLSSNDRIVFLSGDGTRYMPLSAFKRNLRETALSTLILTIQRDISIFYTEP
jgi:hypothetical protein